MKQSFSIHGMTCSGCETTIKNKLKELSNVSSVEVSLASKKLMIATKDKVSIEAIQSALGGDKSPYKVLPEGKKGLSLKTISDAITKSSLPKITDKFQCPMMCEGDKIYPQQGDCPVCGMHLEKIPERRVSSTTFTCPMHTEIVQDMKGSCPICGMELVNMAPSKDEDTNLYEELLWKMKVSLVFAVPVFLISMSEMLKNNPLYSVLSLDQGNWVQFFATLPIVFYTCWMFFKKAWTSILTLNLNMFTLIGIGTGVAFIFSILGLFFSDYFPSDFKTEEGSVHLYFEATAVILTLVLLGQLMEAKAHSQTNSAIKELLKLAPTEAILVKDGKDSTILIEAIIKGNFLRVRPGDKIPVDGYIVEGNSTIDESMISGEPIPVDKAMGDKVIAGTINGNTAFIMNAEKIGSDTMLSQIIKMVNTASRSRAPIQKLADRIAKYFVPIVLCISLLTFLVWWRFGPEPALAYGFINAIAVLIIACPCALGLATPMSVMVGIGKGARSGILIKNAEVLEKMNKVNVLITDKTGTITEGKPSVGKVFSIDGKEDLLIRGIGSLNRNSEHPLAKAVVDFSAQKGIQLAEVQGFEAVTGMGVMGALEGDQIAVGNQKLMEHIGATIEATLASKVIAEQKLGKTVSYISINKMAVGFVTITDAIKENSKKAIATLRKMGIDVIMLTGDNENTASAVAQTLHLSSFKAGCLPEDKQIEIKRLQSAGKIVAMAGDGINDAPALAQADIGIAMGTGTDVAIEAAKITLVRGDLMDIVRAKSLSTQVMRNIKQNLFFAFIYNTLGVPVAAGVLYPVFGILLSPMIAAAAMSFSSVSVIFNALRLKNSTL